jgi:hypothetical protein
LKWRENSNILDKMDKMDKQKKRNLKKILLVEMAGKFKYFGQNGQNGQAKMGVQNGCPGQVELSFLCLRPSALQRAAGNKSARYALSPLT